MINWEYTRVIQVRDSETGRYHWSDSRNWKMDEIIRLRDLSVHRWELAAAYPIDNGDRIIYLLKRPVGREPAR
jgi:hypothetical protein